MKKTISYILFASLILRLVVIGQSFWLDEATSGLVIRNLNLKEIIFQFSVKDFHPPLYYLVLKLWSIPFGTGDIALRLLSVLFGVLTVAVVYKIVKKQFNSSTANIVGLLMATSPLHIYYSHEARMYAMTTFFITLSVYFFLNTFDTKSRHSWIYFIVSLYLGIATDYLAGLMIPVFFLYARGHINERKWMKKFMISNIFLLLLLLSLSPLLWVQLTNGLAVKKENPGWWNILGQTNIKNILLVPVKFVLGRISFSSKFVYGSFAAFSLSIIGFVVKKAVSNKTKFFLYWLVIPFIFSVVIGMFVPVLSYFRLLFILPALTILISLGLEKFKENLFLAVFTIILGINFFSLWTYARTPSLQREDWRGLARFIQQESKDKNYQIVYVANSQMEGMRYYWSDAKIVGPDEVIENADQVWLMRYLQQVFDPNDNTRKKIESLNYAKESEHSFNGIQVWRYNKNESSN